MNWKSVDSFEENDWQYDLHNFLFCIYYGLEICVPPRFICWNLILSVIVFEDWGLWHRWLCHEGGDLVNGIIALVKETPESFLPTSAL